MKGKNMFIVFAVSRVTNIHTYFTGYVEMRSHASYAIQNKWSAERRFATQFATYELADKVAASFRNEHTLVDFLVLEERNTQ